MKHYDRINRVLDYIEANLLQSLSVQTLAQEACMSEWHFQRTFHALLQQPCMSYVRKRRLSWAAEQLNHHKGNLLSLAMDCQFESQEAFTRAFKAQFNQTPGSNPKPQELLTNAQPRLVITTPYLNAIFGETIMTPTLKHLDALLLVGVSAAFMPNKTNSTVIPKLWKMLQSRKGDITNRAQTGDIGVVNCLPMFSSDTEKSELVYLAAVQVKSLATLPDGLWATSIAASDYAFFKTKCIDEHVDQTINYIYGAWLPKSGYERGNGPELEFYPADFEHTQEFEIAIPIRKIL